MGNSVHHLERLAIVGTGLLGASIGLGLKAGGFKGKRIGIGQRKPTLERAEVIGAVDEISTDFAAAAGCSLVLIAVPLGAFESVLMQLLPHVHDKMILTDVGSTKEHVMKLVQQILPGGGFVGSHPMAGSEQQGPDAARADLCRGKPCILTPEFDTDAVALGTVEALWKMLGMTTLHMSAAEHDRAVASISHLPHAAAVMLIHAASQLGGFEVASTGFRDTTRLASSNPSMRSDIMWSNRSYLVEALQTYRGEIDTLIEKLESGDEAVLLDWLNGAKAVRDDWMGRR